jgi:hypothetical protein
MLGRMSGTNSTTPESILGTPPPGHFEEPARPVQTPLTVEQIKTKTREMRVVNRYRRSLLESYALMEAFSFSGWDAAQGFGGSDTTELFLRARS